jgi:hypothetical protein
VPLTARRAESALKAHLRPAPITIYYCLCDTNIIIVVPKVTRASRGNGFIKCV